MKANTYQNPLKVSSVKDHIEGQEYLNPDPFVMRYNGEYYCYSTGHEGVNVLHSTDAVNWTHYGTAFKMENEFGYWAPCVYYYNGVFYMYVSSMNAKYDDVHYEFLKVAVSKSPIGPFEFKKQLYNNFSIDAHVVRDEDGEFYLFYSPNNYYGIDTDRPGTVILVDKLIDMMTPEGKPQLVIKPTIDEEVYAYNRFGDGRDWHTIEGAFYFKRGNKHYVMYSGNAFTHEYYFLGYSSDEGATKISDCKWQKWPNESTYGPVLRKNDAIEGTGHNSVEKAPNLVDDFVFYHGREIVDENTLSEEERFKERRKMRVDPIYWMGDKIWINGPSYTPQDAPAQPTFKDIFNEEQFDGLGSKWNLSGGSWSVSNGEACQESTVGVNKAIANVKLQDYIFEGSLKWKHHHMGGLYGFYASYADEANNAQILIHEGRKVLIVKYTVNGIETTVSEASLEKEFNAEYYHKVKLIKKGHKFVVYLDDKKMFSGNIELDNGSVGLVTYYTMACFDGITVTQHYETFFEDAEELRGRFISKDTTAAWKFTKGALFPNPKLEDSIMFYDGRLTEDYKGSVHVKFMLENREGKAGILAAYKDEDNYIKVLVDKNNKKLLLSTVNSGKEIEAVEKPWNQAITEDGATFHFAKVNDSIRILVDGYTLYEGKVCFEVTKLGLISDKAACEYDYFSITDWR